MSFEHSLDPPTVLLGGITKAATTLQRPRAKGCQGDVGSLRGQMLLASEHFMSDVLQRCCEEAQCAASVPWHSDENSETRLAAAGVTAKSKLMLMPAS